MSAIEQPAARSGRITCWCGARSTSALSAMKWTPQKTIDLGGGAARRRSGRACSESPVYVGELDDLVALVVMAEDDDAVVASARGGGDADVQLLVGQAQVRVGQRLALAKLRLLEIGQQLDVHRLDRPHAELVKYFSISER